MNKLFQSSSTFNQDISNWDVSSVTDMDYMFYSASAFNQDLSSWCVTDLTTSTNFDSSATAWTLASAKPLWGTCPP